MSGRRLPQPIERRMLEILDGSVEDRERRLAELFSEHPEHETTIRERLGSSASIRQRLDRALATEPVHPAEIGPYRVLDLLGEGGMGTVYLAEQRAPIQRRVALKVIKPGMDSKQVLARFEVERQALGLMSHPGIARVFDAGTDERQRPYFSMEYVEGIPIHEYCDREELGVRERLTLFLEVCGAAQHAHQKGVIHRDLKPSNILVTEEGGEPRPKIIDFGLARAMDRPLTEQTLFTQIGAVVGTPEYMSPEQAGISGLDLDTRTDIYSLGVVLYVLLSGSLPFDSEDLRGVGQAELTRRIREQEPPKPSTRVSTGDRASTARPRAVDPVRLARQLHGDLDWITLKAIAVDRDLRYQSAGELAADIGRFLRDEPILAGPPSAVYRMRKFVRRYRIQVVAAAAVLLALVIGLAVSTVLYFDSEAASVRAEARATEAREVTAFLMDLFRYASPSETDGGDMRVRMLFHAGAERIRHELEDQPLVRASLLANIGKVYGWLGSHADAEELLAEAVQIREPVCGADDPSVINWKTVLGSTILQTEGPRAAAAHLRALLDELTAMPDPPGAHVADAKARLGGVLRVLGQLDDAERLLREATDLQRALYRGDHDALASALASLAKLEYDRGRYEVARRGFEAGISMHERLHPGGHPSILGGMQGLSRSLVALGSFDDALAVSERALAEAERLLGRDHPWVAALLSEQAFALNQLGRHAEAVPLLERALAIDEAFLPADHIALARTSNDLGSSLMNLARYEEAGASLQRALSIYREVYRGDHPHIAICMRNAAETIWRTGEPERAERLARDSLEMVRRLERVEGPEVGKAFVTLARVLSARGRFAEAERAADDALALLGEDAELSWWTGRAHLMRALFRNLRNDGAGALSAAETALEHLRRARPGDQILTALALYNGAWARVTGGDAAGAEPLFVDAIEMFRRLCPGGHPDSAFPLAHFGGLLLQDGRTAEALPHLENAADIRRRFLPADDIRRIGSVVDLGRAHLELGNFQKAQGPLTEAHEAVRDKFGPADARTVATVRLLVDLYERWERPEDAARCRALLPR